jgi:CheY-like chemotaxis protein
MSANKASERPSDAPGAGRVRASVLMVDDRPANLLALEATLESPELDLVRACSGDEALRLAPSTT